MSCGFTLLRFYWKGLGPGPFAAMLAPRHTSEKAMAPHSNTLAWRIPGMAEPGGLPSMGSHRVGHDWSNLAAVAADKPLPEQQNTKNLYQTENNSVCVQLGKILDPKDTKRPKNPTATFEEPGAKARYCAGPLHTPPPEAWAKHLSHPAGLTPGHTPTLILYKGHAHLPQGASKGTCCFLSMHPTAAGAPIQPCLYFWSGL